MHAREEDDNKESNSKLTRFEKPQWDTDFMIQLDRSKSEEYFKMKDRKAEVTELAHQSAHGFQGRKFVDQVKQIQDDAQEKGLHGDYRYVKFLAPEDGLYDPN